MYCGFVLEFYRFLFILINLVLNRCLVVYQQRLDFHFNKLFHPFTKSPMFIAYFSLLINDERVWHSPAIECFLNLVAVHKDRKRCLLPNHCRFHITLSGFFATNRTDRKNCNFGAIIFFNQSLQVRNLRTTGATSSGLPKCDKYHFVLKIG